jgi:hypothetical protein
MGDEHEAEDVLTRNWSQYTRAHKTQCVGMTSRGGSAELCGIDLLSRYHEGCGRADGGASCDQDFSEDADEESLIKIVQEQEDDVAEAATPSIMSSLHSFDGAIGRVEKMLDIARSHERKPEARVRWLIDWIKKNMFEAPGRWNERRLIVFTQWEDTRIWLERRLKEAFAETDRGEERMRPSPASPGRIGANR